jgi:alkanesulfonate monooxygenase SsuD/methylene tetrahydromethanopterin reductase-like flavin-dependent oxidoreductase (luciferase family)
MRISTSLPDGKWREVGEAARTFKELGFDQAAAHEVQHDSFATLVPATLSTHRIGLTTSVAIAFPRSPMIVANGSCPRSPPMWLFRQREMPL